MILISVIFLLILYYIILKISLNYWKTRSVPYMKCGVVRSFISYFYEPIPMIQRYWDIFLKFPQERYVGCYRLFKRQLLIRDPDLMQHILIKDFEFFHDRGSILFSQHDPMTHHIFSAPGKLWKDLRNRLTPTFTSGKMKFMFNIVKECANEYQEYLQDIAKNEIAIDFKAQSAGYTMEVINSAAFGVKTHSISNSNTEFKIIAEAISNFGMTKRIIRFILEKFSYLLFCFRLKFYFFGKKVNDFFFRLVKETVDHRKKTGIVRNDFIQILMTSNDNSKEKTDEKLINNGTLKMTNELMTAQCFVFFVAGYDTSSFILSLTLLELAMNPEIQKSLQGEIDYYLEQNNGQVTYEIMKDMPYLHRVVQETMRMYPVLPFLSRICARDYKLPGTELKIEKGTEVLISIIGLHREPKYYPEPEKFNPDRFLDEKMKGRHNFVYMPFGLGPRNCIGSRFGLMSVKLGVISLLQKYRFFTTSETVYPVRFQPYKVVTACDHPIILGCSLRNN